MCGSLERLLVQITAENGGSYVSDADTWPWAIKTAPMGFQKGHPLHRLTLVEPRDSDGSDNAVTHPSAMIGKIMQNGQMSVRQGLDAMRGYVGSPKDRASRSSLSSQGPSPSSFGKPATPHEKDKPAMTPGSEWLNWISTANVTLLSPDQPRRMGVKRFLSRRNEAR